MWVLLLFVAAVHCAAPGINGDFDNPELQRELREEASQYLYRFGYLAGPTSADEAKVFQLSEQEIMTALTRFQREFLYYGSGEIDVPTQAKFDEYRCGNRDMYRGQNLQDLPKSELWKKKTLTWNITSYPTSLSPAQTREACDEAFEKWHRATGFNFVETNKADKADIVISFSDLRDPFLNVASIASKPVKSQIILDRKRQWGYRNHLPFGISLFHTLLHEIGHVMGLHHSFYRGSMMYPMLKPALVPFGTLDDVPGIDKIAFRKLYGLSQLPTDNHITDAEGPTKCPKQLDSVTSVSTSEWLLFRGQKVYRIDNKRFIDNGRKIQDVFPRGPGFVNATVTANGLTLLFAERTIYGYEYDGSRFREAQNFPRELHERVLFYPQSAFPLNNGSVVILSGNVFATYNIMENVPSILNDKNRIFPNLPVDLRSGVPVDPLSMNTYYMFDEATVTNYNMLSKEAENVDAITDFFKC